MSPSEYVIILADLSLKKLEKLKIIYKLTLKQGEAIKAEDLEGLGKLIDEKQKYIDETLQLDKEFEGHYSNLKLQLKVDKLDEIKNGTLIGIEKLKTSIADVMNTLKTINSEEMKNSKEANKLLNSIGSEIKKINMSRKTIDGYNQSPKSFQTQSRFIDQKK